MSVFEIYLRTGRRHIPSPTGVELKFNPWHDPTNGRFTFAEGGRRSASGVGGGFGGGGATGRWEGRRTQITTKPAKRGDASMPRRYAVVPAPAPAPTPAKAPPPIVRTVEARQAVTRNGYTFAMDGRHRVESISGALTRNPEQTRSRSAQAGAGGSDRLPSDEGGHYIARRFNGPTDAFNHFAQDANFNRGRYKALENGWDREAKAGKRVFVSITPRYIGSSQRPSTIKVKYTIDGVSSKRTFSNGSGG